MWSSGRVGATDGGDDAQVDREAVDAAVAAAFDRFTVVGFYADPALWQDYMDRWTQRHAARLRVKAQAARPLEWWTNRPTAMVAALERFHTAVLGRQLSHDGGVVLTSHVLNARRRIGRRGDDLERTPQECPEDRRGDGRGTRV
jgi:hypothetical protein